MSRRLAPCLAALLLAAGQDPKPEDRAATARLVAALDATGLQHERSPSGKSQLVRFDHPDNRQQTVMVTLLPNRIQGRTVHSLYTTVWSHPTEPPDDATMHRVLSSVKKLGGFYLSRDSTGAWSVRFGVRFDATGLPEQLDKDDPRCRQLADLIAFVDAVGEETDAELNGNRGHR